MTTSSRIPRPTWRDRNTTRVESAWPVLGRHRDTKVAEKGSFATAVSVSVRWPLTRSSRRDKIRESRTNSPCEPPRSMSPDLLLIANVDSSTRVIAPLAPPASATWPE